MKKNRLILLSFVLAFTLSSLSFTGTVYGQSTMTQSQLSNPQGLISRGVLFNDPDAFIKEMQSGNRAPIHVYMDYGNSEDNQPVSESIIIEDLPAESTVVLISYEPMAWKVFAKNPSKIKSIIAIGYYAPQVFTGFDVPVQRISIFDADRDLFSLGFSFSVGTSGLYKDFVKDMNRIFGSAPATVQSAYYSENEVKETPVIDGIRTTKVAEPVIDLSVPTVMKRTDAANYYVLSSEKAPQYAPNEVGFHYVWWASYYTSNRAYKTGKHYFEVTMNPVDSLGTTEYTNVGIGTMDGQNQHPTYMGSDHDGGYSYGAISMNVNYLGIAITADDSRPAPISFNQVRKGDVIGVAADLDNHRVKFSINGVWVNGDPLNPLEGRLIEPDRYFYALGNVSCPDGKEPNGDIELFNFGDTPFKYPVPQGYTPFGKCIVSPTLLPIQP